MLKPEALTDDLFIDLVALAGHTTRDKISRLLHQEFMAYLLEREKFLRGRRLLAQEETVNILAVSDMMRAGITGPTAAGMMVSIREQLLFYPSDIAHIEFRRNGRLFAFVTDDAPEAADAAGPMRFRLTIDLGGYRAAFREALAARHPATDRAAA